MDNLPDGIYYKDRESRFTRINLALANQFGLSHPSQAAGKTDFDFFSAEHAQEAYRDEQEIIRTGRSMVGKEEKETWPDGRVTWVLTTKMPLRDAHGNIIGTFGVSRDVTQRKLAEEALRASEEKYRSLVSNIPDVVWTLDAELRFVFISKSIEKISGFSVDEIHQHGAGLYLASLHPDDVHKVAEGLRALFAEGRPYDVECRIKRKTGEWRWVHDRAHSTYEKNGIRYADGLLSDITERKRAEEALRNSEEKYRVLYESSRDAIVLLAPPEWKFTAVNPTAIALFEARDEREIMGADPWNLSPAYQPDGALSSVKARQMIDLAMERGSNLFEWTHKRFGGEEFFATVMLTRMIYRGQPFLQATIRDITERKRVVEELHQSQQMLHAVLDTIPQRVFWKDRNSVYMGCNKAFAMDAGLQDPAEIIGKNDYELAWKETAELYRADDKWVMEQETPRLNFEEPQNRPDGSLIWLRTNELPLRDREGKVTGLLGTCEDITDRKRAEAALIESEKRFRGLVENATVGIYRTSPQGRIVMANLALVRMLGYKDFKELAVRDLETEGFAPDYPRMAFCERIEQEGEVRGMEAAWTKQDGSVIFVRESARAIRSEDGKTLYFDGVVEDITERKRAEEEVGASEIRYRSLFEAAHDGILILDADSGEIKDVNPYMMDLLGYSRAELLGKKLWDIGLLSDVLLSKIGFQDLQNKEHVRYDNLPLETHDGKRLDVEFVSNVYLVDRQKVIQCNIRDMTEHKRADAERTRLVTAIEQSPEGVVITNTSGDIEYVNPAFTRITGYAREEVLGQNPRILKSGQQDPALYQQLWATLLKGKIWHGELVNRRKDGTFYSELMSITPVRSGHGEITHFVATKQDITARKQLEQQFLQAQKMEAVGRLAGGVAHDFNNLLTIINGYAQLLMQQSSPQDPRRGLFEEILVAGERAASLTRQLLAFSRRQVMDPRVLDLNSVLAAIEKMLRRLIGEDVELVATFKPDLGRVKVDPGQIEQVIMNLAINARDAMPEGGKLCIETSNLEIEEGNGRTHPDLAPGKYVMVAVSDTGRGMDAETRAHIFEPFFTTKEKGHGTGLGLATVYGIVKQSGGSLRVYSELGQGTTFKIYLPCVEESLPVAEPTEVRTKPAKGSETVLVVEDEEGVRLLVGETLKARGYKVLVAEGAAQALKIAEQHAKPIHLLLTDVVMPQTGGKELAKRLSTLHPETRVLYMSGYTDDAIVRHGILQGSMALLQKPFAPNALARKVREVLKRKPGTQQ
jgi:PAS domain S-box-containing protein